MIKNETRHKNIKKDTAYYKEKCESIKKSTDETTQAIQDLEKQLKITISKKNLKVKYNQLSLNVLQYQPIEQVEEEIKLGKRELKEILEERETIIKKLNTKEKKFAFALASLKNFLESNESEEETTKEDVILQIKKEEDSPILK